MHNCKKYSIRAARSGMLVLMIGILSATAGMVDH